MYEFDKLCKLGKLDGEMGKSQALKDELTNLRRWSWCYSYSMWLCVFHYEAFYVESCLVPCSQVSLSCLESWSICLSCICLFIMYALLFIFFLPLGLIGCG